MSSLLSKNNLPKVLIYGTIATSIFILAFQFFFVHKSKEQKDLEALTIKLNKICPHSIGSDNLIESISTSSTNTVVLNIAFTNISKSIFQTDSFRDSVNSIIATQLNQDEDFKVIFETNAALMCSCADKNGKGFLITAYKKRNKCDKKI